VNCHPAFNWKLQRVSWNSNDIFCPTPLPLSLWQCFPKQSTLPKKSTRLPFDRLSQSNKLQLTLQFLMADPTEVDVPARKSTTSPPPMTINHRSSFAENLRHSPRSARHPSFTQAAVQELLNHPPAHKTGDQRFAGRDWRQIRVGELVDKREVRWAQLDSSVEKATEVCMIRMLRNIADLPAPDRIWTTKCYPSTRERKRQPSVFYF
jgi:hypothetical protein